jgi:hypothetical protein
MGYEAAKLKAKVLPHPPLHPSYACDTHKIVYQSSQKRGISRK